MNIARVFTALVFVVLALAQAGAAQDLTHVPLERVQKGAQIGSSVAQIELANRYLDGIGVLQNYATAAHWFEQAAKQGDPAAQNGLGKLYHTGFGVTRDVPLALHWLSQAASAGRAQFMFDYASVLETPEGGAAFAEAAEYYRRAAEAGHIEASVSLAVLYQSGTGVPQDLDRARALYEAAAQVAHPRALNNLGLLYVRGDGVAQNYDTAAQLFAQAAELGLSIAMTNLGVMYENGFGVPLDDEKAATLYRMASSGAANENGLTYYYDTRLAPMDIGAKAMAQTQVSSEAGDPVAQFQLGWALATQDAAASQNLREAAQLFAQAADAGHGPAMANLSLMYFKGQGLPQDYMLGHMWLLLANRAGVDTRPISAAYGAKVTADQVNAAQDRALVFFNAQAQPKPKTD